MELHANALLDDDLAFEREQTERDDVLVRSNPKVILGQEQDAVDGQMCLELFGPLEYLSLLVFLIRTNRQHTVIKALKRKKKKNKKREGKQTSVSQE